MTGIAVDGAGGKFYWSQGCTVWRANLDGSCVEEVIDMVNGLVQDLAVDAEHGYLYMANWSGEYGTQGRIQRVRLDGSDPETLGNLMWAGPLGMCVDLETERIFCGKNPESADVGAILQANLDGSERQTVLANADPDSLALDLTGRRIYWTDYDSLYNGPGTIHRVNYDGSTHETLPIEEMYIGGIAIISDSETPCPGDLDGDNAVELDDLAQLLGHYGATGEVAYEDGDLDGDGDVDLGDLAELLGFYGTTC